MFILFLLFFFFFFDNPESPLISAKRPKKKTSTFSPQDWSPQAGSSGGTPGCRCCRSSGRAAGSFVWSSCWFPQLRSWFLGSWLQVERLYLLIELEFRTFLNACETITINQSFCFGTEYNHKLFEFNSLIFNLSFDNQLESHFEKKSCTAWKWYHYDLDHHPVIFLLCAYKHPPPTPTELWK